MKKLLWILISLGLLTAGTVYAAVSVPNSTGKGNWLSGLSSGNYQTNAPCANGLLLAASSTSLTGWACTAVGGTGTVTSVDATVPTGLSVSGVPITGAGTIAISLQAGYNIPLTASTTNWNNFYNTPSTRITAGSYLTWSGNTLNSSSSPYFTSLNVSSNTLLGGTLAVTGISNFNGWTNNGNGTTTSLTITGTANCSNGLITGALGVVSCGASAPLTSIGSGNQGVVAVWNGANTLTGGIIFDNGTVAGINATSSTVSFNVKSAPALTPFIVASSTGTALLTLTGGGALTITGSLNGTTINTGNGSNESYPMDQAVLTTSNVTFANASTTNLTVSTNAYLGNVTNCSNGLITTASGLISCNASAFLTSTTANALYPTFAYASSSYATVWNLQAGSNITISTSTPGIITISSTGGGSGNSAWTIGSSLIYNATSTDSVLIGTSTPVSAKLFVQGSGTKDIANFASSTGTSVFKITSSSTAPTLQINKGSATTTMLIDSTSASKGACLKLKDADGTGYTYCVVNNGSLTCGTASCE